MNLRKLPFVLGFDAKAGGTGCKAVKLTAPNASEVVYANTRTRNCRTSY